jgi:hypothetical protein
MVGRVGIEPTTNGLKGRLAHQSAQQDPHRHSLLLVASGAIWWQFLASSVPGLCQAPSLSGNVEWKRRQELKPMRVTAIVSKATDGSRRKPGLSPTSRQNFNAYARPMCASGHAAAQYRPSPRASEQGAHHDPSNHHNGPCGGRRAPSEAVRSASPPVSFSMMARDTSRRRGYGWSRGSRSDAPVVGPC